VGFCPGEVAKTISVSCLGVFSDCFGAAIWALADFGAKWGIFE